MNKISIGAVVILGSLYSAQAAIYSVGNVNGVGTDLGLAVPDATYPAGVSSTLNISGESVLVDSIVITLNITGGWNGDLYCYLAHDGQSVTLLNNVGTGSGDAIQSTYGYSTSGFINIILAGDGTSGSTIHSVENPVSGSTYAPDGGSMLSFVGGYANGDWTLFLADSSGGNVSTLQGWSLTMTSVVPEPVNVALGAFGGLVMLFGGIRWYRQQHKAGSVGQKD